LVTFGPIIVAKTIDKGLPIIYHPWKRNKKFEQYLGLVHFLRNLPYKTYSSFCKTMVWSGSSWTASQGWAPLIHSQVMFVFVLLTKGSVFCIPPSPWAVWRSGPTRFEGRNIDRGRQTDILLDSLHVIRSSYVVCPKGASVSPAAFRASRHIHKQPEQIHSVLMKTYTDQCIFTQNYTLDDKRCISHLWWSSLVQVQPFIALRALTIYNTAA